MSTNLSSAPGPGLHTTTIESLPLVYRGKVRDIYRVDASQWLIVTTDRVSAYDVILPTVIPDKGKLLTELALFWFDRMRPMIPNHLVNIPLEEVLPDPTERSQAAGRSMIVRRLNGLPIEAVVRGHLAGSAWTDYRREGRICGIELPPGLRQAERLERPIFTPATKAAAGEHDENISYADVERLVGAALADDVRRVSLALYRDAARYAEKRGLIIADTKFEFGTDSAGNLVLMDEILTPDSSRFWESSTWALDMSPPSHDKQYLRDWLETLDWDKTAPGPTVPEQIVAGTLARYREAVERLTAPETGA